MPIAIGAKNVFVAAPKTLQYPNAATNKGFKPKTGAIITPKLDQFMDLIDQAPDNSSSGIMGDENTKE